MKKLILIVVTLIYMNIIGFSQEFNLTQKDSSKHVFVSASLVLSHFIPTDAAADLTWKTQPLSPGGEILIGYEFNNNLRLITGLNYQFGKIFLSHFYYGDRTFFHEGSIPLLISFPLDHKRNKYHLTTGFYIGKYFNINRETKGGKFSTDMDKWNDFPVDNSSNFISDLYLGFRYKSFEQKIPISFEIFSKYRVNEHWLNEYVSRFHFGIKINYSIKF